MQTRSKQYATSTGYGAPYNLAQAGSNTTLAAGLSVALCFMVAGGVPATNTITGAYVNFKKPTVQLIVGNGSLKIVPADDGIQDLPPWVQELGWIKEHADVTVSRLADVFGVTRKAFYGWIEGAEPRKGGSQVRISVLREIVAGFPTLAHRSAFFGLVDEALGDGKSFREVFQSPVDEPDYRERLNGKLAELAPVLEVAANRLNRPAGNSKSFEIDYSSA